MSKFIITRYNAKKAAIGILYVFSEAEDLVIVAYEFSNGVKDILFSEENRIYSYTHYSKREVKNQHIHAKA